MFPLHERLAVCAFELEHVDGCMIVDVVKESEAVARTPEAVVAAGKTLALVERVTDDILAVSVVPFLQRNTQLLVSCLSCIFSLEACETPCVSNFKRYGPPPDSMDSASATSDTRIDIKLTFSQVTLYMRYAVSFNPSRCYGTRRAVGASLRLGHHQL